MNKLQQLIDILQMEKVRAVLDVHELDEDEMDLLTSLQVRVDTLTFCIEEAELLLNEATE